MRWFSLDGIQLSPPVPVPDHRACAYVFFSQAEHQLPVSAEQNYVLWNALHGVYDSSGISVPHPLLFLSFCVEDNRLYPHSLSFCELFRIPAGHIPLLRSQHGGLSQTGSAYQEGHNPRSSQVHTEYLQVLQVSPRKNLPWRRPAGWFQRSGQSPPTSWQARQVPRQAAGRRKIPEKLSDGKHRFQVPVRCLHR